MGFESCILINHDYHHEMTEHPERFARDLWRAISTPGNPTRFSAGLVVYTDHADGTHLVIAGHHIARVLTVGNGNPADREVQLALLREAASSLGYKLVRKPVRVIDGKVRRKKKRKKDGETPPQGDQGPREGSSR